MAVNTSLQTGYVQLLNYGAFVVRFFVQYNLNGKTYTDASGVFPVLTSRKINIPRDAINVQVLVQLDMFINTWLTLFNTIYPKSDEMCFLTWGITAFAYCKEIPCTAPGLNSSGPNIPNIQPYCNCCCCHCCSSYNY